MVRGESPPAESSVKNRGIGADCIAGGSCFTNVGLRPTPRLGRLRGPDAPRRSLAGALCAPPLYGNENRILVRSRITVPERVAKSTCLTAEDAKDALHYAHHSRFPLQGAGSGCNLTRDPAVVRQVVALDRTRKRPC